jgi:predicted transcriptional regulator
MMTIKITTAESQVMEALWRDGPLSPEEIIAAVGPDNGWQAGTVRTLITRLLGKKAIRGKREKAGYRYSPLITRNDYIQDESKGFLDRLFKGEVAPLVAHLAEHRALSARDVKKLKKLISELEDGDD